MTLDEMIAVLEAAKRGEKIEFKHRFYPNDGWRPKEHEAWNTDTFDYRVAPKITLVEELRHNARISGNPSSILFDAASKIEELERQLSLRRDQEAVAIQCFTDDKLLEEVKRRLG